MNLNAYSLYDRKTLVYNPPFFAHTDGAATRMVADLVSDNNTTVGRHPNDYVLYNLGIYDDQKGTFLSHSPLIHVIDVSALVPPTAATAPLFNQ